MQLGNQWGKRGCLSEGFPNCETYYENQRDAISMKGFLNVSWQCTAGSIEVAAFTAQI